MVEKTCEICKECLRTLGHQRQRKTWGMLVQEGQDQLIEDAMESIVNTDQRMSFPHNCTNYWPVIYLAQQEWTQFQRQRQ
jgi:hypothetical protein